MKLIKQKTSMIFVPWLTLVSVLIFGGLFIRLQMEQQQFKATLGEMQVDMLYKYDEAEQALFYLDQAGKYSAYQAIHELANKGGFFSIPWCGESGGYYKYIDGDKKCYYETMQPIYGNFKPLFNSTLLKYLDDYPNIKFPNNYDFTLEQKEGLTITGIPASKLIVKIKDYGNYTVKPSFKATLDYNMNDYGLVVAQVKKISQNCSSVETTLLVNCVESLLPNNWALVNPQERTLKFEVASTTKYPYFDGSSSYLKPVTIKLAVTLPDVPQKEEETNNII